MPFEAMPPGNDEIVTVRVWGAATLETGQEARAAAITLITEHDCKRVLVDFKEARIVVPMHVYLQYYSDTAKHYPPETKIALVISNQTVPSPIEDMELARVASLAGGIVLRDFRDLDQARDWLMRL